MNSGIIRIDSGDEFVLAVRQAFLSLQSESSLNFAKGERLLLALSGGPDSTALLLAMHRICQDLGLELESVHVNHGLRAAESDSDEEFCRQLCSTLGLQFWVRRLAYSKADLSDADCSEAALREARYQEIVQLAGQRNIRVCLTGHTLDDQVETMLFRLFRGTGPLGLMGIPSGRCLGGRLVVLRPMLELERLDCRRFLDRAGVQACIDSSNENSTYARNFIRNEILPLVEGRFPSYRKHLQQLKTLLEADESLLANLTDDALLELAEFSSSCDVWQLDNFSELPLTLRRRVIYESLRRRLVEADYERIENLLKMIDQGGAASVCLNKKWRVTISGGKLRWLDRALDKQQEPPEEEKLNLPAQLEPCGLTLMHRLGLVARVEELDKNSRWTEFPASEDYVIISNLSGAGKLEFRLRKEGDKIQPLGMPGQVRLKKYLHTHKSTKTLSFGGRVLVLANADEVLWVPGLGISQKIAVGLQATHRISLMRLGTDDSDAC